jgi:hypothetical protein
MDFQRAVRLAKERNKNMRTTWTILFFFSASVLLIAIGVRAMVRNSASQAYTPPRPDWYAPQSQTFETAWRRAGELHSLHEPDPASLTHVSSLLQATSDLATDPNLGDYSFFKMNGNSWNTAFNVEVEWAPKPWSVLTREQIQDMKARLDSYLLSVNQVEQSKGTWKTIPVGLRCNLIPIAFAPRLGSLLCVEPDSDLLFVLANNNDRIDVGTFNYCSSAWGRIIVIPTYTRLQSVLTMGACNDDNIVAEDRSISDEYVKRMMASAGVGESQFPEKEEPSFLSTLRFADIGAGGILIVMMLYSFSRMLAKETSGS